MPSNGLWRFDAGYSPNGPEGACSEGHNRDSA
jgi:hypothetical protein